MEKLFHGLRDFRQRAFPSQRALFEQLSKGQSPEVLFITCADSRIDPSLLAGSAPGELFILRNAGNLVPEVDEGAGGERATIEYAVTGLKVTNIIVCGHSSCGAVGAALAPKPPEGMPEVARWLKYLKIRRAKDEAEAAERLADEVAENVRRQLAILRQMPCVKARLEAGTIELHGMYYDIGTGSIFEVMPSGLRPLEDPTASTKTEKESGGC